MIETIWDPTQYARFGDERGRPFRDLLSRVGATEPSLVVDLGCGNGPLTLTLSERWPRAEVIGLDSSPEMLEEARRLDVDASVRWVQADLRDWDPSSLAAAPDVVVTNATLQWVPGHLDLIGRVVSTLAPGGWFAMQVPDNFGAPSHALMRDAAAAHRRSTDLLPAVSRLAVEPPETYLDLLAGFGCEVDVWSTTYLHVLDPAGEVDDPVLEWVRGTGLRPLLAVLTDVDEREEFLADYRARLREAYPRSAAGVVMPFRRTFAVARMREV